MNISGKAEYIAALRNELSKHGITDNEILEDFEQHFAIGISEGLTEAQVCEKLGTPEEIAMQYIPEGVAQSSASQTAQPSGNGFESNNYNNNGTYYQQPVYQQGYQPQQSGPSTAKIVGVICLDVLIFSWALPALFSLLIGYWAAMISFLVSGIALIIGGSVLSVFGTVIMVSGFTGFANVFAGITLIGISLIMMTFCIDIWKGAIKICKGIGKMHMNAFCGN